MRGRMPDYVLIILDKTQNIIPEQMEMFLVRAGFDFKTTITGGTT